MKHCLGMFGFVAATLVTTSASAADAKGAHGQLVSVQINAPGSDDYSRFRGVLEIKVVSGKGAPTVEQYVWGGSNCPNRDLAIDQVQLLSAALHSNVQVLPLYKAGQLPNSRCLVAFKLFRPGHHAPPPGGSSKNDDKPPAKKPPARRPARPRGR